MNKRKFFWLLIIICSILAATAFTLYGIIRTHKHNEYTNRIENPDRIINREFLGVKFKDNRLFVDSLLDNKGWCSKSYNPATGVYTTVFANVEYGDRTIDTLQLSFYKELLFQVWMKFNITYQDQQGNWTFNEFEDLFLKKHYYPEYASHEYNNVRLYSDPYTRLRLWHSCENYHSDKSPSVCLTYYDKTSGYEEAMNQGF